MLTPRRKAAKTTNVAPPDWVADKANQSQWNRRFIGILDRDYRNTDPTIRALLESRNPKLAPMCATKIRSYLDKDVTAWMYAQRKMRGAKHKELLETALPGLKAAIELFRLRGNKEEELRLSNLVIEWAAELGRCKQAYSTKRHGRDRAHSGLSECRAYLESELSQPVTNPTLASLVNAGYEANGEALEEPITEEHIRKNLANFARNNPCWRNNIDVRIPRFSWPETK